MPSELYNSISAKSTVDQKHFKLLDCFHCEILKESSKLDANSKVRLIEYFSVEAVSMTNQTAVWKWNGLSIAQRSMVFNCLLEVVRN